MPNTRDIRRRIRSINNTRQITRAMEMVAATKMRKAQQAVLDSRAYAAKAEHLFAAVSRTSEKLDAPLLERRPVKRVAVILATSDRGLCGAMNTNVFRKTFQELVGLGKPHSIIAMGRKGEQQARIRGLELTASFTGLLDTPEYQEVLPVAEIVVDEFTSGRVDAIYLAYPKFVSTLRTEPVFSKLLPADVEEEVPDASAGQALTQFEPSPECVTPLTMGFV